MEFSASSSSMGNHPVVRYHFFTKISLMQMKIVGELWISMSLESVQDTVRYAS